MANRAHLVSLRGGSRGQATLLIRRLDTIFANGEFDAAHKLHELETKHQALYERYQTIEDLDQQIFALTQQEDVEADMVAAGNANAVYQDALSLYQHRINVMRRAIEAADPDRRRNDVAAPSQQVIAPTRATSRPKITLPRFNGEILQWRQFWQAFQAEIHSDDTLANINKFNYLVGQLEPNVLSTVAGLTPSNENYPVLVNLLTERFGSIPKITAAYMRALYTLSKPEGHLKSLRLFYDSLESYVRGLEALGKAPDTYGDLLVCILMDKLPIEIRKNVARQHDQDEWTLEQLRKALRGEIRVMEAGQSSFLPHQQQSSSRNQQQYHGGKQTVNLFSGNTRSIKRYPCVFCSGDHAATQCQQVTSVEERKKIVGNKKICSNCFGPKHQSKECQSPLSCRSCGARHHSSLHSSPAKSNNPSTLPTTVSGNHCQTTALNSSVYNIYPFVFLKTAIIKAQSQQHEEKINALFDEGAQRSWMTRDAAKRLGLRAKSRELLILSGFANAPTAPKYYDLVELVVVTIENQPIVVRAIVIDFLVNPLEDGYRKNLQDLAHLKDLRLAHPFTGQETFHVDILIGADFYWQFIGDEAPIRGQGPTAVNSKLGYLVSGPLDSVRVSKPKQSINLHIQAVDCDDLSFLWSLEKLGIFPHQENVKEATEYADKCIEFEDGQYTARFPWKSEYQELPANFNMVQNMTRAIIKRLAKEPEMLAVFSRLIEEQLKRNFIEKVPAAELAKNCHYIPYHYVKRESTTTPIRIVYNCSCKGWNGVSFNDCVEAGAPLHNDQTQILINFRTHAIGIVADVEKAFHHINLHKDDRDFLRWFWLEDPTNPESPLAVYRFRVVPFGAKSSPFILNAVMMHHLKKSTSEIASDMLQSVFVDNIITGCASPSAALNYYTEANRIMDQAHLPLQAWGFSDGAVEKSLAEGGSTDPSRLSKTLGLIWNREKDTLNVQPPHLSVADVVTKRDVLKGNGAFYDPLGFYAPLGTSSKILIQDMCIAGLKIDDELSIDHLKRWKEIVDSINVAVDQQLMSLPRSYFGSVDAVQELHVFCDASRRAYGAVAYLYYKEQTAFVMSKARITPIKDSQREGEREISIPEAELMAAYLGTLLATTIIAALKKNGIRMKIFLWSDSQIIHFWISKSEGHPRQFITNRVKKIREFTQQNAATWRYVPSEDNPADILSRGATLSEFKKSSLWRSGPHWLVDRKMWPIWSVSQFKTSTSVHLTVSSKKEDAEEEIGNVIDPSIYSWEMLLRITGQIYRLLSNLKKKDASRKSWNLQPLNALELQDAENVWIRFFQRKHLAEELKYLQGKKEAWRPSLVSQLDLFLDGSGIIRCKGRLQNAGISESAKHPVLIPKKTVLARLLITSVHQGIAHYGVDYTIAHLMQKYWIPSARTQVKAVCRNCPKCRRESGPSYRYPDPAPLPADRVQENYPFAVTGVDYTGAIQVTSKGERISVYILLFTCGVTRAIHLEVVEDMTAGSFINALKRFTGHHPIPRLIYSDNASTFVNASNHLLELFNHRKVQEELATMRILWKFIPKAAPWYGGWWERLIALTKTALRKMVGRTILSFTQLQTVTTQIEAILNDRSLTKISTDENCIQPLTPSHLLYGQRLTTLPYHYDAEEELLDPSYGGPSQQPQVMTKAYLRSQNILRSFRRIWNSTYVPSLREHHQKTKGPMKTTIKVGDVVQIQSESKRANWKLAIIESINRGGDGQVRSAELRTAAGRTSRPINKLYPVEVSENSSTTTQDVNIQPRCIINENRSPSERIPRQAARQASEKIKNIAYLENIIEE